MRFLRFPVLGAGQNDRAREQLVREETPEEIAAAQAGIDAYWANLDREMQIIRDEDEAYARNYATDKQAEHINSRVSGVGPGYEEEPGWMRRAAEKEDPEAAAADQKYLDWLEDEWQGHERGNPPKSRELDEQVALAAQYFPEPEEKDYVTVFPYEPGDALDIRRMGCGSRLFPGRGRIDQRPGSRPRIAASAARGPADG